MDGTYDDIISRIGIPPVWFDEHAVPRYCAFTPHRSASIHIGEIALIEITCQGCGRVFHVALSAVNAPSQSIAEAIRAKTLPYGDPPNIACCVAPPSSNIFPSHGLSHTLLHDPRPVQNRRSLTPTASF